MATPKHVLAAAPHAQQVPVLFQKTAQWHGVKVGHYRLGPGHTPEHAHRTHQVFVPLAGAITIKGQDETGNRLERQRTVGEISVAPAGKPFSARWERELDYVSIYLTEDFLDRATIDFSAHLKARLVLTCGPRDELVRSIAHALVAEVDAELPAGKLYAESLVNALAVHLLRHYSTDSLIPDLQFGGLSAHKLRRALDFIETHLEDDLSLTEIAETVELSQYHFARAFKQTTGQTPIQFLMQRRVEAAKQLLTKSELPIVEVGLRTGFKNQSHFTTLFRRLTSLTPRAYRNSQLR
jgi:AraC family transcriptional regulator